MTGTGFDSMTLCTSSVSGDLASPPIKVSTNTRKRIISERIGTSSRVASDPCSSTVVTPAEELKVSRVLTFSVQTGVVHGHRFGNRSSEDFPGDSVSERNPLTTFTALYAPVTFGAGECGPVPTLVDISEVDFGSPALIQSHANKHTKEVMPNG
jgi:hypothetical protein